MSAPGDVWAGLYDWVFNVGKYLLVGVQVVVLGVFFSRFIFDEMNNDLTDNINDQVEALESPFFKQGEVRFNNIHDLLNDIALLQENQITNSEKIGGVLASIPKEFNLEQFSYADGSVSLDLSSSDEEAISIYENQLETNPLYQDVSFALSKSGTDADVEITITFSFKPNEDNIFSNFGRKEK